MKFTRRLLSIVIVTAMVLAFAVPALASREGHSYIDFYGEVTVGVDSSTLYLGDKSGGMAVSAIIYVDGIDADTAITDIKSSNPKVILPVSLSCGSGKLGTSVAYDADILVAGLKKGSATISFKVNGKTYKQKLKVVGYVNPVKSMVLSQVSTVNQKSKFAKGSVAYAKLKKNAKAGALNVSAASGWKITEIDFYDCKNDSHHYFYADSEKGVASVRMMTPAMKKAVTYRIGMKFLHTKTKATQRVDYWLNFSEPELNSGR